MLKKWYVQAVEQHYLKWLFIVLLLLGLVAALVPSHVVDPGFLVSDKLAHAVAFFGFAFLLDLATKRSFFGFQVPLLLAYGAGIEVLQSFTPWRLFSVADFAADALGILMYWLLFRAWLRVKPLAA